MNKETLNKLIADLIEYASNPGYSHGDYADTMRQAAAALAERSTSSVSQMTDIDYLIEYIPQPVVRDELRGKIAALIGRRTVSCQLYGHAIGNCDECNIHYLAEAAAPQAQDNDGEKA